MASFDRKKSNQVRIIKPTQVQKKKDAPRPPQRQFSQNRFKDKMTSGHQSKSVISSMQVDKSQSKTLPHQLVQNSIHSKQPIELQEVYSII